MQTQQQQLIEDSPFRIVNELPIAYAIFYNTINFKTIKNIGAAIFKPNRLS
jgi:hypothetical protein